jgi:hypothetical protein
MEQGLQLEMGVAPQTNYDGRHRAHQMHNGIGLIPHGDRNRVKQEYEFEERESLDKYSKYYS